MEQSILKDKVILIVDDYKINAELVSFSVSDSGAIPLIAYNGKECIGVLKKQKVDMILMDHHMPVMDGIEATKIIRSMPEYNNVIIIGFSGSDEKNEEDICLQAGMNGIIDKLTLNNKILTDVAKVFFDDTNKEKDKYLNVNNSLFPETHIEMESAPNIEVMNFEKALLEFDNDKDLLLTLLEDFNSNIQSQIEMIKKAIFIKDYECIQRESHGIKGGAANLDAFPLAEAAKSLEKACKQSADIEMISDLFDELSCNVDLFSEFVKVKILDQQI